MKPLCSNSTAGSGHSAALELMVACRLTRNAGIAACARLVALGVSIRADEGEALHTTASGWCLRGSRDNCIITVEGSVPVDCNHVVWGPADWAALATANEFHGLAQSLGACDLRALLLL